MKKLLLFGAGKIGRSFIAPIFENAGYATEFADIDPGVVGLINSLGEYTVSILDSNHPEKETVYTVKNISAVLLSDREHIMESVSEADLIVTSVGKRGLASLVEIIARGLKSRFEDGARGPVNIIFAENIKDASGFFRGEITKVLPGLPLDEYVGLVETSIGKMVPIMTGERLKKDPLGIFAEPYNTLIVDESGFIKGVPDVPGLAPKKNMKAWVDRKIFIHNLGHAVLAYQANFKDPSLRYTWEALKDSALEKATRDTMLQSAKILIARYPDEFTEKQLKNHIDDLLDRFSNRALGDTIFRVGCDLGRKLNIDDRLMIPILAGRETGKGYSLILDSWVKACFFKARDENGAFHPNDDAFRLAFEENPERILSEHCKLDSRKYADIYWQVEKTVKKLYPAFIATTKSLKGR